MIGKTLFAIVLVFTILNSAIGGTQECPSQEELSGNCKCVEAYGKVFLSCKKLTNIILKKVLNHLSGYEFHSLSIAESTLLYLPSSLMSKISVMKIEILDTEMYYLADDNLYGQTSETLSDIIMRNVSFHEGLDWSVLEDIKNLKSVSLTSSPLLEVSASIAFANLDIEGLDLSDDRILMVYEKAFSNLKNLKNLILKQNAIDTFKRSMLPSPTSNIQFLDLSNNKLSSLPEDAFDGMPKLHSLLIDGNKFTMLDKTYMIKIWDNLIWFSIGGNPLKCDCHLSWMIQVSKDPYHLKGQCDSPTSIKGKQLKDFKKDNLIDCIV